jgi:translocation and assembly module TamB
VALQLDEISARVEMLPAFAETHGVYDLRAILSVERDNAAKGRVRADSALHAGDFLSAVFDVGSKGAFNVTADALEAKGGALAGSAGLAADQPFSLTARAAGDVRAGRFSISTQVGAVTPFEASGAWNGAGGAASGQIMLTSSRLLQRYAAMAGPAAQFQVQGHAAGDGFYALGFVAKSDNITATGQGEADVGRQRLGPGGLAVDLRIADPGRIHAYPKMGPVHVWGRLDGGSGLWRFAGSDDIASPSDSLFSLARVSGPLRVEVRKGEVDIEAGETGEGGAGTGLLAALLGARPSASASMSVFADGRVLVRKLDVVGDGLKIDASGDRGLLGGLSFKGEATIDNLAAAHPGATGEVKADWTASQGAGQPWSFSFDAQGDRLATGLGAELDRLLGAAPRLRAKGAYQNGGVDLTAAELDGATGAVNAKGRIGGDGALGLALGWTARGPMTIGPLEISGAARGAGDVSGTLGRPKADLTADFSGVDLPMLPLRDAHLTLSFQGGASGADGRFSLVGDSQYGAARGASSFRFAPGGVDLTEIAVDAAGIKAAGSASLRSGEASSADLTLAIGPGLFLSEGRADGRVRIVKAAGAAQPRATIDLSAADAVLAQGGAAVRSLKLTAAGPLNRLPFNLTADGAAASGPWHLSGGGQFSQSGPESVATFAGGGRFGRVNFHTQAPARFDLAGRRRSATLRLNLGNGEAALDASQEGEAVEIKATVSNVDLGVLSQDYVGRMNASLDMTGRGAALNGLLDAKLAGAGGRDMKGAPPVDGEVKARLAPGAIVLDATLGNSQGLTASSHLALPAIATAAPLRIAVDTKRPMNGKFAINGELKPIWDLLMGGDRSLGGRVAASGTIGGSLADPQAVGTAALDNGQFQDASSGLKLQNVTLRAALANNAIDVSQFSAADGGHGQMSGSGRLSLLRDGVSTFRIDLQAFRLIDNDLAEANASGRVNVNRGADGRVKLSGDLTIDRAQVSPNSPVASGVVPMEVVEIHRPADFDTRFAAAPRGAAPVSLDLHLHAPGGIIVKGRGLNLELSLDARVAGTSAAPVLSGEAHVVRGDYNFAGQRFQIADSGVVHLGSTAQAIRLDLTATREDPTLTAVIRIEGTAAKPTITLTSTPVLPRDEVLSQVLFGASASQLSPLQAAQLASAVSGLASGGGFDVIGGLRNFAHLDRLAISDTTTSGGTLVGGKYVYNTATTVSGGKYIRDNVYLELIGGREGSGAQVEWQVRKHVSLVSRVTSQGDSQVSVRWRKDY